MKKQDVEIEKTLHSLDKVEKAHLSPLISQRIYQKAMRLEEKIPASQTVPAWSWAIGLAALLLINVGTLYWMQLDKVDGNGNTTTGSAYFDNGLSY